VEEEKFKSKRGSLYVLARELRRENELRPSVGWERGEGRCGFLGESRRGRRALVFSKRGATDLVSKGGGCRRKGFRFRFFLLSLLFY
jgi:hypothetical protein